MLRFVTIFRLEFSESHFALDFRTSWTTGRMLTKPVRASDCLCANILLVGAWYLELLINGGAWIQNASESDFNWPTPTPGAINMGSDHPFRCFYDLITKNSTEVHNWVFSILDCDAHGSISTSIRRHTWSMVFRLIGWRWCIWLMMTKVCVHCLSGRVGREKIIIGSFFSVNQGMRKMRSWNLGVLKEGSGMMTSF